MATFMDKVEDRLNNPTALVYINGRALLCFSKINNQAEVGFLELDECHELFVTIYKPDGNPIPELLKPVKKITVNSNHSGRGALYYSSDSDDEDDWDNEDFRHVLDFDDIHKAFTPGPLGRVKIRGGNTYLARLFIKNATFFTAKLSRSKGRVFAVSGGSPGGLPYRKIGKIIGAQIDDSEVKIDIEFKDGTDDEIMLQKTNKPYKIMFRYKCIEERAGKETDFEKFYGVLQSPLPPGHRELDFEYDVDEPIERIEPEEKLLELFGLVKLSDLDELLERKDSKFMELIANTPALEKMLRNILLATEACQAGTKSECPDNLRGNEPPVPC